MAAAVLSRLLPSVNVTSAGLHAVIGSPLDPDSLSAARLMEIDIPPHVARQFTVDIGNAADLILVMEARHRREIAERWPQFTGKTFLLGHFESMKEIMDPYRRGSMMHIHMVDQVLESARLWAANIHSNQ